MNSRNVSCPSCKSYKVEAPWDKVGFLGWIGLLVLIPATGGLILLALFTFLIVPWECLDCGYTFKP